MDDSLSKTVLSMFKYAPLLLLFNGYWMLDNKQIFERDWSYIMRNDQTVKSNHFILHSFEISYSTPLFIVSLASIIIALMQ